jgi:hypothetical protein
VDDPEVSVSEQDLIAVIGIREVTDLRIRAQNERTLRRWADQVAKEERNAAKETRAPELPEPPELRPEEPSPRTIEYFCRAVKAMFGEAHRRGQITYQPWTPTVDDETVDAAPVRYTTRNVASREQIWRIAGVMARYERTTTDVDQRPCIETGERYQAMVVLAGIKGPRPEETDAIRDSWVQLDGYDPKIVLYGAEVYHSLGSGQGRQRAQVDLKHRPPGTTRILHLTDEPELVEVLRRHREQFVAKPDPDSNDPDTRDPYFFTSHLGLPIDRSSWVPKWWKAVVQAALDRPGEEHLHDMPFRRLRAAAITHWLVQGKTLHWCAKEAGNTQAVIENHYQGVLNEIDYDPDVGRRKTIPVPLDSDTIRALIAAADETQLAELFHAARSEVRRRMDDDSDLAK